MPGFFDAFKDGTRVGPPMPVAPAPNMGLPAPASTTAPAPQTLAPYSGTGINVGAVGVGFNPQSFVGSDAYNFIRDEGAQGIERSAAAKGTLLTGGTLKDLTRWGQGNASTFWGNQLDHDYRMAALNAGISEGNAGRNLSGLSSLAGMGLNAAGQQGGYLADSGFYTGSGTQGAASAMNKGMQTVGNTLADYFAKRRAATAGSAQGGGIG